MSTATKDFKVKNGLIVTDGGTFGGTVSVDTPTENTHATTKQYVDELVSNPVINVTATSPSNPVNGQMYIDSDTGRLNIFLATAWIEIATLDDTFDLKQHIHDTAIDGTGLIVSIYQGGAFYDTMFTSEQDAGYYDFNEWAMTWNGGVAIDNFN